MSKIIFFTDLHAGLNLRARPPENFVLYGHTWAEPLLKALIRYGETQSNVTMIHGGDEATYLYPSRSSKHDRARDIAAYKGDNYYRTIHRVSRYFNNARFPVARVIGNHEPIGHFDKVGLNSLSHIFSTHALPNSSILICQPNIRFTSEGTKFEYDPDHVIALIDEIESPNLIVGAHWAFDRSDIGIREGEKYEYKDRSDTIKSYLNFKIRTGKLHSVISLHGHSHRFRNFQKNYFDILTMPSISQTSLEVPNAPSGLFCEIEEDQTTGELTKNFKRILLIDQQSKKYVVQDVPEDQMKKYSRGKKFTGDLPTRLQRLG